MVAQVIVDVVHTNVARPFSYLVPEGAEISVGARVSVPLGRRRVDGIVVELLDAPPDGLPLEKLRPVGAMLDDCPALLPALLDLARELSAQAHCPLAETLRLMLPAAMRTGRVKRKKALYVRLAPGVDAEAAAQAQRRAPKRAMLLRLLDGGTPRAVKELEPLVSQPREALNALEKAGLVVLEEREVFRAPDGETDAAHTQPPEWTPDQREALDTMLPALRRGEGAFLLHGVTGSGTTEVYLAMVAEALKAGKGAIILVPEIALTPQMVRWFRARFGPETAVLHSRLTDGQRCDEWRRIRLGYARVVVGARSAVFAPVENLGLIVIDEEHEQTYLSDRRPRYDAREVAAFRCQEEGATLVLSSATPSILSFAKARRGDYTLLEMPCRVMNRPLPTVEVVDMRAELAHGNRSIFSAPLLNALRSCMERGEQAMLLMNRRGYHAFVSCRACGHVMKCPNCDVAMTYHVSGGDGQLHCHYCGCQLPPPEKCPACGSAYIRYFGAGTQQVEEALRKLLPGVPVGRMDIDTTSGKDGHQRLLDDFRSGRTRILVGTQMIAKGLDFPRVTLVGVVAADMTLNLPDYRARERTFQLLTQVAGRAGRGNLPGQVFIQTYKPEDPVIQAAARQDYRSFFEEEFDRRRTGLYPPFTLLARLLVEAPDDQRAQARARTLYNACRELLAQHPAWRKRTLLMRLDAAPVKFLRGKSRYQVLFKLFVHGDADAFLGEVSRLAQEKSEGSDTWFEVNPANMM